MRQNRPGLQKIQPAGRMRPPKAFLAVARVFVFVENVAKARSRISKFVQNFYHTTRISLHQS